MQDDDLFEKWANFHLAIWVQVSSCVASDLAQGGPDMTDDDFGRPLNSSHLMPSNSGPSISQANRLVYQRMSRWPAYIHSLLGFIMFYPVGLDLRNITCQKNTSHVRLLSWGPARRTFFAMPCAHLRRNGEAPGFNNADDLGMVKMALGVPYMTVTWDDWLRWWVCFWDGWKPSNQESC